MYLPAGDRPARHAERRGRQHDPGALPGDARPGDQPVLAGGHLGRVPRLGCPDRGAARNMCWSSDVAAQARLRESSKLCLSPEPKPRAFVPLTTAYAPLRNFLPAGSCIIHSEGHTHDEENPVFHDGFGRSAGRRASARGWWRITVADSRRWSASTGPTELAYVPADASVVAFADVRSIMNSELRQRFKQSVPMPMGEEGAAGVLRKDRHRHRKRHRLRRRGRQRLPVDGTDASERRRRRPRPVRHRQARRPGARARRPGPGIQGQAAADPPARSSNGDVPVSGDADAAPDGQQDRRPRVPRAGPRRPRRPRQRQARHRRAAERAEHHQQQRDDGARAATSSATNNAWAVGRFDLIASQAKLPDEIARQIPPSSGSRSPATSTAASPRSFAPKPTTTRPPRTCAASSTASSRWRASRVRTIRSSLRSSSRSS